MKRRTLAVMLVPVLLAGFTGTAMAVSGAGAINLVFPIGARYAAMGESGIALSQDATAIWWNPGGLAYMGDRGQKHDIHIMQSKLAAGLADDIALYWGGYATVMGQGVFGAAINYLDMGTQEGRDEFGGFTENFSSYMFALSAVYGVKVTRNVGVGIGVKYFRDRLAPDAVLQDNQGGSGDSFGVDLGMLWKIPSWRMNLGATITNLGPDIKHVDADQSDPMPRKVAVGLAYNLFYSETSSLLLVGDYLVPLLNWDTGQQDYGFGAEFDEEEYGVGAEWSYVHSLFFRFGYKSAQAGDIQDTTWGFGFDLARWVGKGITFDYASVPQATGLDRVNRLSLGFRF